MKNRTQLVPTFLNENIPTIFSKGKRKFSKKNFIFLGFLRKLQKNKKFILSKLVACCFQDLSKKRKSEFPDDIVWKFGFHRCITNSGSTFHFPKLNNGLRISETCRKETKKSRWLQTKKTKQFIFFHTIFQLLELTGLKKQELTWGGTEQNEKRADYKKQKTIEVVDLTAICMCAIVEKNMNECYVAKVLPPQKITNFFHKTK